MTIAASSTSLCRAALRMVSGLMAGAVSLIRGKRGAPAAAPPCDPVETTVTSTKPAALTGPTLGDLHSALAKVKMRGMRPEKVLMNAECRRNLMRRCLDERVVSPTLAPWTWLWGTEIVVSEDIAPGVVFCIQSSGPGNAKPIEQEIRCPFCDEVYDDYDYRCVNYHSNGSIEVKCLNEACGDTFLVTETVRRTYETKPMP